MATKRGTKSTRATAERFNNSQFVNYELNKAEKGELKAQYAAGMDLLDLLNKLIEAGYRVSFKYDTYTESPACWLSPVDGDDPNGGLILPGRGRTAESALAEACFKHWQIFKEIWPHGQDRKADGFWED